MQEHWDYILSCKNIGIISYHARTLGLYPIMQEHWDCILAYIRQFGRPQD